MDWDSDGDEDFTDGLIEGSIWFGPSWVVVLVLVVCLALFFAVKCNEQPQPVPALTQDVGQNMERE